MPNYLFIRKHVYAPNTLPLLFVYLLSISHYRLLWALAIIVDSSNNNNKVCSAMLQQYWQLRGLLKCAACWHVCPSVCLLVCLSAHTLVFGLISVYPQSQQQHCGYITEIYSKKYSATKKANSRKRWEVIRAFVRQGRCSTPPSLHPLKLPGADHENVAQSKWKKKKIRKEGLNLKQPIFIHHLVFSLLPKNHM